MEIIDTVYLVAYLDPDDPLHEEAAKILEGLSDSRKVSQAAIIELDLLMKSRRFTPRERIETWMLLAALIDRYIEPLLPSDLALAVELTESQGMDYFDSLVAAQCINRRATALTSDPVIKTIVDKYTRSQ